MTARDGFSHDMYRFALDAGVAERLLTGSVDIADAPPPYRAAAGTLHALREAPEGWELAGERDAVDQIAAAVMLERQARPVRPSRRSSPRVAALAATAVVVCALPLTGGLASAGALPAPAQNFTSTVLSTVGISVPTDPADDRPPPPTSVPAPPRTTGSSPNAGGPGPDLAKSPPRIPSAPAPGNPNKDDGTANNGDGHGGAHVSNDSPEAGNGNGHDR